MIAYMADMAMTYMSLMEILEATLFMTQQERIVYI